MFKEENHNGNIFDTQRASHNPCPAGGFAASCEIGDKIIAITNRHLCERPYLEQIERICLRKPGAVLVREKDMQEVEYEALLAEVAAICHRYGVPCIAHTYVRTARENGIQTAHFPLHVLKEYEAAAEPFALVGTSVHSIRDVQQAEAMGAGYLIAGHIFTTGCKPGLKPRGKAFLAEACAATELPVYAVGGMAGTEKCLEEMMSCGAAGICVMSECMRW